jgi:3-oxoacyl-[acyl-carrier protein] reductase
MVEELKDRHALVCGGSEGIGKAAATALAHMGCTVTLLARDKERLIAVRDALPALSGQKHRCIVSDMEDLMALKESVLDAVAKTGGFHVLLNNSGGPSAGPLIHEPIDKFESVFRQHVLSAQTLTQLLLDGMIASGYGRIINVISTSVKAPLPNLGVSNTVRGAMSSWAKTLASEVAPWGITVNNVLPGATDTARLRNLIASKALKTGRTEEQVAQEMQEEIPLGRFAQPEEVAHAIAFLASPRAAYISGINLPVDGGRLKNL